MSESTPELHAITRPLDRVPSLDELLEYADPHEPLVWLRGDRGCVGVGEVLRLSFAGPDRFADAADAWRRLVAQATIDDPVESPGSGLLAFGTFAFDDHSETPSVLTIPRLLIARHGTRAWITEIGTQPLTHDPALPQARRFAPWAGVELPIHRDDDAYLAGARAAVERIEAAAHTHSAPQPASTEGALENVIEKIVIARSVAGEITDDADLRVPLEQLTARYDDCWVYAVDGMMGASPETLVRRVDGAITARVLAGTRGRKQLPAADTRARDDLLSSEKEQHEHAFAVQSVVTAFAPHVRELDASEQPYALELPNVWHLATDITAVPSDTVTSLELAAALHPTAAVAGTPTAAAVSAIAELEPFDRGRYAGPVGWIDADGDGEWVIGLRCAQVGVAADGVRSVTAYAGGGIVAGSDPAHEFGETVSKFTPIADAFRARGDH